MKIISNNRIISIDDNNIENIRRCYPDGLHFVVGDTHGETRTLQVLMNKIEFDHRKDHVYFVGDYNEFRADRKTTELLSYISQYYQEDYNIPGFHLIRGNHERDYKPGYPLNNLPDIIVIRGRILNYYLVHAGMVKEAFSLICNDMKSFPDRKVYAYCLSEEATAKNGLMRQIVNSRKGLYSQSGNNHLWPAYESLCEARACIIHGHTPYFKLKNKDVFSYGSEMLFWEGQKIWFSEDLQSLNIDSGIKKHYGREAGYSRRLSCICLEMLDEIAEKNGLRLTCEGIRKSENFVFSQIHCDGDYFPTTGDINKLLLAKPEMKIIL